MSKKIAILRGINVGGKRKILMTDLKLLCENLGWKEVKTYIQSGNIIFQAESDTKALEEGLATSLLRLYGFEVPVIVRNADELRASITKNPFYDSSADINTLHLTFLKEVPIEENLNQIRAANFNPDQFAINDQDVFIYCTGKYHESKLTNNFFEKKLKVAATTRNWKTVLKLIELSSED